MYKQGGIIATFIESPDTDVDIVVLRCVSL